MKGIRTGIDTTVHLSSYKEQEQIPFFAQIIRRTKVRGAGQSCAGIVKTS
jgi:hypothetical protein